MTQDRLMIRAALRLQHFYEARVKQAIEDALAKRLGGLNAAIANTPSALHRATATLVLPLARRHLLLLAMNVRHVLKECQEMIALPWAEVPALGSLLSELRQLEEEFLGLTIDLKNRTITARTEPITLEEVYLGPFAIELNWERLLLHPISRALEIGALEPNPASSDELVTHPHVKDNRLCAGEADDAIQKALSEGRFCDAFCLVRGVLTTYNPKSPYEQLDNWDDRDCYDCGDAISGEGVSCCEKCSNCFCEYCSGDCAGCQGHFCTGCSEQCPNCKKTVCANCLMTSDQSGKDACDACLRPCAKCGDKVTADELDPQTLLCENCRSLLPATDVTASSSSLSSETPLENAHAPSEILAPA